MPTASPTPVPTTSPTRAHDTTPRFVLRWLPPPSPVAKIPYSTAHGFRVMLGISDIVGQRPCFAATEFFCWPQQPATSITCTLCMLHRMRRPRAKRATRAAVRLANEGPVRNSRDQGEGVKELPSAMRTLHECTHDCSHDGCPHRCAGDTHNMLTRDTCGWTHFIQA